LALLGCALLLAAPAYRSLISERSPDWIRQLMGPAAALLFAALAYAAFRSDLNHAVYLGGWIGGAGSGRLLFSREAVAVAALGSILLCSLVALAVAWRVRAR
jgi:hypothetical protein